jgi:hypothetical protein
VNFEPVETRDSRGAASGEDGHEPAASAATRRGLIRAAVGGAIAAAGITRLAADPAAAKRPTAEDNCDPSDPDCEQFGAGRPGGRTGCILLGASQRGNAPGRFGAGPAMPSPVLAGLPWYEAFDSPVKRGAAYWIGTGSNWGMVRAAHAVCLRPPSLPDPAEAWSFYDQGYSDACVGFATARMLSLFNTRFYNGTEMYNAARQYDRWPGANYVGTSVDGGMEAAMVVGGWRVANLKTSGPFKSDGIRSWAWLETSDDILLALGTKEPFIRLLNSWGPYYPREVRLPLAALNRLVREGGNFVSAVDRPTGSL